MKALITLVMFAGLALTMGAQAAAISDFVVKSLGSTSIKMVSEPSTTPLGIGWTLAANGDVNGAEITWTPRDTSDYKITVKINGTGTKGSATVSGTADTERTDHVDLSPTVDPLDCTSIKVTIKQK